MLGIAAVLAVAPCSAQTEALHFIKSVQVEQHAVDVRWESMRSLLLAVRAGGTLRLPLDSDGQLGKAERASAARASFIGVSPTGLAAGVQFRANVVEMSVEGTLQHEYPFLGAEDLDLDAKHLLVLGLRSLPGEAAPLGEIAWLFDTTSGTGRAVLFSASGKGAPALSRCGLIETGAVRFLSDGSFVIVPGVDDGVHWFDAEGKVLRVWSSQELGIDSGCPLSDDEVKFYDMATAPRRVFVDARRVVDEILATPSGPALVVRSAHDKKPSWQLILLGRRGKTRTLPLSIPDAQEGDRLKGDMVGTHAVLLTNVPFTSEGGATLHFADWTGGPTPE
ncbi:MAG: hypothetical protein ABI609_15140 [Acidobacteriota bacterium]